MLCRLGFLRILGYFLSKGSNCIQRNYIDGNLLRHIEIHYPNRGITCCRASESEPFQGQYCDCNRISAPMFLAGGSIRCHSNLQRCASNWHLDLRDDTSGLFALASLGNSNDRNDYHVSCWNSDCNCVIGSLGIFGVPKHNS